jgi:hypothetical protein
VLPKPSRTSPRSVRPSRRIYTPFADPELDLIDRWGFSQRIRVRSAAIRALVLKALAAEQKAGARQ